MNKLRITMAHGSGGAATNTLISGLFQKYLSNPYLDRMDDAAVLPAPLYPLTMTTDSFVVNPLFFPGGDIGKLAVCGTVNDLWMMGSEPLYLTAGFILEEGLELSTLEVVVRSLGQAAQEAGVAVVAGDTKVIEGQGGLYINTSGMGQLRYQRDIGSAQARVGDSIIVSGHLGNHQACILSARLGIANSISSDCANLGQLVRPLLEAKLDVRVLRDITRGGLATVLNEIATSSRVDLEINEEDVPVAEDVRGFCEILGLDPLYMANEGKLLCVVAEKDTEKALALLQQQDLGAKAAVIGRVSRSQTESLVTMRTKIGGKRIIDILYGEGLPRIC